MLEQIVAEFTSRVTLVNLSNGKSANAKSVLSLVSADVKKGDQCVVELEGAGCGNEYDEIVRFMEDEFPCCDEDQPTPAEFEANGYVPPVLRVAGVHIETCRPIVAGFGRGKVVHTEALKLPNNVGSGKIDDVSGELSKIEMGVDALRANLTARLDSKSISVTERNILRAHLSIANDVELSDKVKSLIEEKKVPAGVAIVEAFEYFSGLLSSAQSEIIRERVADLKDICTQLIEVIYGSGDFNEIKLVEPTICVAEDLTPSQFISLEKSLLCGLVLTDAGATSHTVILARSFGIPTVSASAGVGKSIQEGQEVIVDADYGLIVTLINPQVERFYESEREKQRCIEEKYERYKTVAAKTKDGFAVEVMANVSMAEEVAKAVANGADGIGLFRTEMLFMTTSTAPTEQEQFEQYKIAAEAAAGRDVIIRTFDIGGDKPAEFIELAAEDNPFLGCRGVRLYRRYEKFFADQLRAILRASAFGNLKIMVPMVSCVEEVDYVINVLNRVKGELSERGCEFNSQIELGIMVEVPAAAFILPQLAGKISFVSIGTNDLTQYFIAVDRGNELVSDLYNAMHPGVISIIRKVVEDAHQNRIKVGLCGEAAANLDMSSVLVGTEIDELSVSIPSVPRLKAHICMLERRHCSQLLECTIAADTAQTVQQCLEASRPSMMLPIVDEKLVCFDVDCVNKEEVIKFLADRLHIQGRSNDSCKLEVDFWLREQLYSTGLGFGIAVPHCKSKYVLSNSITILRLRNKLEWGSLDGEPVDVIIGMTIKDEDNAGNEHMRIFSTLAKNIMHEEFRNKIRTIDSEDGIVSYLREKLFD
jgi:fructose-specific PTS system IIA-like component